MLLFFPPSQLRGVHFVFANPRMGSLGLEIAEVDCESNLWNRQRYERYLSHSAAASSSSTKLNYFTSRKWRPCVEIRLRALVTNSGRAHRHAWAHPKIKPRPFSRFAAHFYLPLLPSLPEFRVKCVHFLLLSGGELFPLVTEAGDVSVFWQGWRIFFIPHFFSPRPKVGIRKLPRIEFRVSSRKTEVSQRFSISVPVHFDCWALQKGKLV